MEGEVLPSFTDPNGNPVQRDREAIFAFGGIQRRPVIEKGDGSWLTSGFAKDALWTAQRIAEANELGLNTADFWEARPDVIQAKIEQAKQAIAKGEAPEAAAIDSGRPKPPSSPEEAAELARKTRRPGSLSPELMEQAKREAWYRYQHEAVGPTNWTHYWDAARRARGFEGLPKALLDLEINWRVPPPEVMAQQKEAARRAEAARQTSAAPPAVPPAHYSPPRQAPGGRQPAPMPTYPHPGASVDPGFNRPWPEQTPMPAYPQLPGEEPLVHDSFFRGPPQTGFAEPTRQYTQPPPQYLHPMADLRMMERMRQEEMASYREAQLAATPGVLKERAQRAWDQRRSAEKRKAREKY